ncbi:MAG: recombinase family protein [Candidatus Moraniibacteriota bacterium]|nr:MAG: recombinase family protein [Candidatus Moranbacteria bacterium]
MYEKANKYILYARKSSESEDRQMASIESQVHELQKIATQYDLNVIEVLTESMSAKAIGRPVFNQMISKIQKREADGILCWKINRLTRNALDGGMISHLLQEGFITNIKTQGRDYYPSDNVLLMNVELGMANQFIRDLSTDTKRGLRAKAERGWFPGVAPYGYAANPMKLKGDKEVLTDPERFDVIRKAFKGIASGEYTPMKAYQLATKEWGLRNRNGSPIANSTWYAMLNNPFYYGEFEYPLGSGNWYSGKHVPIITKAEFLRIQTILGKRGTTRPDKYDFTYRGTIQCGSCGAMITAENKVKRNKNGNVHFYTYYHCTGKKNPDCPKKVIEEKELESQIGSLLESISIPASFKEWAVRYFRSKEASSIEEQQRLLESQKRALKSVEDKLDRLLELRLSNEIPEAVFTPKREAILQDRDRLKKILADSEKASETWIDRLEKTLSIAEDIKDRFQEGNEETKKLIINGLGSNLFIKERKFLIEATNPILKLQGFSFQVNSISQRFEPLKNPSDKEKLELSYSSSSLVLAWRDSFRTFEWEQAIPYPEGTLAQISKLLIFAF